MYCQLILSIIVLFWHLYIKFPLDHLLFFILKILMKHLIDYLILNLIYHLDLLTLNLILDLPILDLPIRKLQVHLFLINQKDLYQLLFIFFTIICLLHLLWLFILSLIFLYPLTQLLHLSSLFLSHPFILIVFQHHQLNPIVYFFHLLIYLNLHSINQFIYLDHQSPSANLSSELLIPL